MAILAFELDQVFADLSQSFRQFSIDVLVSAWEFPKFSVLGGD